MSRRSIQVSIEPPTDTDPTYRLQPYGETVGIPVLNCYPQHDLDVAQLTFNPTTPQDTIRYLRLLAAAATDLADEIERAATTDAVLKS